MSRELGNYITKDEMNYFLLNPILQMLEQTVFNLHAEGLTSESLESLLDDAYFCYETDQKFPEVEVYEFANRVGPPTEEEQAWFAERQKALPLLKMLRILLQMEGMSVPILRDRTDQLFPIEDQKVKKDRK